MGSGISSEDKNANLDEFEKLDKNRRQSLAFTILPELDINKIKRDPTLKTLEETLMPTKNVYHDTIDYENIFLITMNYDILVCDLNTKKIIRILKGHRNYINQLIIKENGYLYSLSSDYTIRKWDINLGICLKFKFLQDMPRSFEITDEETLFLEINTTIYIEDFEKFNVKKDSQDKFESIGKIFIIDNDLYSFESKDNILIKFYKLINLNLTLSFSIDGEFYDLILLQDKTFLLLYREIDEQRKFKLIKISPDGTLIRDIKTPLGLEGGKLLNISQGILKFNDHEYYDIKTGYRFKLNENFTQFEFLDDHHIIFAPKAEENVRIVSLSDYQLKGYYDQRYYDTYNTHYTKVILKYPFEIKRKEVIYEKIFKKESVLDIQFSFQ